ncbi:MAG: hypothetical protein M4579_006742 [Chaenotheca gracillima]|nr:MAG: hypothetical protein M4579_006742 [Chaenotheca gracillima]
MDEQQREQEQIVEVAEILIVMSKGTLPNGRKKQLVVTQAGTSSITLEITTGLGQMVEGNTRASF